MDNALDAAETATVSFEWTLRGLRALFDASKGELKSKVTKSVKFGAGQWQILFYANSGAEGGGFVSLYLSCEPTAEEKDRAPDGKWVREGVFKFSFELRSLGKTVLFNIKEAHNHSFSSKTANWGWAQFAKRDHVFYHSNPVKESDAFLIICTITSSPRSPVQPPTAPAQLVPKNYLECIGDLLDDPLYSDVEFVIPKRSRPKEKRSIYANKKILQRADYFQSMFGSGFVEASTDMSMAHFQPDQDERDSVSELTYLSRQFEDSDDEEDDLMSDLPDEPSFDGTIESDAPENGTFQSAGEAMLVEDASMKPPREAADTESNVISQGCEPLDVTVKPSQPSSPISKEVSPITASSLTPSLLPQTLPEPPAASVPGPKKMRVVVKDVAYATYKAVLYYIYTDVIVFAPLASSFVATASNHTSTPSTAMPSDSQSSLHDCQKPPTNSGNNSTTRREWIKKWQQSRPGRPAPCSAKAVYRLADKLGLLELRERAYQHISKSLNVENIPFEVFSPFSATFAEVRKVQVSFFLEHWSEIRASDTMCHVWRQIRIGRHPGFEEVWPYIALHLEFNPRTKALAEAELPEC